MCWTARRPSRKHRARRDGLRPEEQLVSERVVNAAPGGEANVSRESLYSRRMPGGGSVRVELLVSNPTDVTTERLSGRVVIERRGLGPLCDERLGWLLGDAGSADANTWHRNRPRSSVEPPTSAPIGNAT